ncbi:MAG: 30S ribosomal protein S20 [Candidatus Aeolococcus gillhamiae]|uniref:Small ribosomal subunit protein bS20 n=3 Tax=Candidatus Aeolococcus gillhamiae TaxID=3127015 RepID=A0A2W5ZEF6_9BACT|nr:MAG: 30S ribosomal protein S20 [Candidatus Dormibacter sp. RRmetagenome_bin12]
MANSRSARKRIRANERKHVRNRGVRSSVRTYVGKARQSLLSLEPGNTVDVEEQLKAAVRALDRAAEKGILHRNNVNRRKSRLTAMAARLIRAASEGGEHATELRAAAAGGAKGRGRATTAAKRPAAKAPVKAPKAAAKSPAKATSVPKTAAAGSGAAAQPKKK